MKHRAENHMTPISRAPGNIDDESYYRMLDLAARDPRAAMEFAAILLGCGDGSNYAAIAANMTAVVSYARLLESSEAERNYVFGFSAWEGYPPTSSDLLLVGFRARYGAWRTKTAPYERARVHFAAMRSAYRSGIQLHQIRGYIEEHGVENLYAWSQRPADAITLGDQPGEPEHPSGKQVLPDLSGQDGQPVRESHPLGDGDDVADHDPLPHAAPSSSESRPPAGKPPRTPKYAGDVPPSFRLEVCLSDEDRDYVIDDDGPDEFTVLCRRVSNGGSDWIRIDGKII